jgi:hypothetical protein
MDVFKNQLRPLYNGIFQFFPKLIEALKRKGLNAMTALSKFLVLLAIFLSASHANAFTSLSLVAGNQVGVIHLI